MKIQTIGNCIKITPEKGMKIINKVFNGCYYDQLYLAVNDNVENYREVQDLDFAPPSSSDELEQELMACKREAIQKSKDELARYLEYNPLKSSCHGGKSECYTITFEKQQQFSIKFLSHQIRKGAGYDDVMTWNAAGKTCEPWTDAECIQFLLEVDRYVSPLVAKQQRYELMITAANSMDEIKQIELIF